LTRLAFDLADQYRTPVMILTDGRLGQMMEPLELSTARLMLPWRNRGVDRSAESPPNMVRSLYLVDGELEVLNLHLQEKYARIRDAEVRFESRARRTARFCWWPMALARAWPKACWPPPARAARSWGCCARLRCGVSQRGGARGGPPRERRAGGRDEQRTDGRRCPAGHRGQDARAFPGAHGGAVPTETEVERKSRSEEPPGDAGRP